VTQLKRALITVMAVALLLPSAVSGHDGHTLAILESDSTTRFGYDRYIPVCLHTNYDGPTGDWDLTYKPHATVNNAMQQWNAIGGEFAFYRANEECDWLAYNHDDPFVQIGYSAAYDHMQTQTLLHCSPVFGCNQPWTYITGPYVDSTGSNVIPIWINPNQPWFWGTGDVPSDKYDAWTALEHELGHVLALKHTEAVSACGEGLDVMMECFYMNQENRSLSVHDINGYAHFYGFTH
jgi:hypothetical protein